MIQRLQTVYLAFVALLNGIFLFTPLFNKVMEDPSAWLSSIHIAALAFASMISVYAIFIFKDRAKQIQWVKIGLVFQVMSIGSALGVLVSLGGFGMYLWDETLSWILLSVSIILQFLAIRGIAKDDALVRSMDRIR